jgi:hypothetical protein
MAYILVHANKGMDSANKGMDSANKGMDSAHKDMDSANKGIDASAARGIVSPCIVPTNSRPGAESSRPMRGRLCGGRPLWGRPMPGRYPRGMHLDATEQWLIVAGQSTGDLVALPRLHGPVLGAAIRLEPEGALETPTTVALRYSQS